MLYWSNASTSNGMNKIIYLLRASQDIWYAWLRLAHSLIIMKQQASRAVAEALPCEEARQASAPGSVKWCSTSVVTLSFFLMSISLWTLGWLFCPFLHRCIQSASRIFTRKAALRMCFRAVFSHILVVLENVLQPNVRKIYCGVLLWLGRLVV